MKPRASRGQPLRWLYSRAGHDNNRCLIWPFARRSDGVGHLKFRDCYTPASRVMCSLAHGKAPTAKHQAAHSCGNGAGGCVNPRHLRWATPQQNAADKIGHGTVARGERHGASKLSETDVLTILDLLKRGLSQAQIGRQFSVNYRTIWEIAHCRNWRHLALTEIAA